MVSRSLSLSRSEGSRANTKGECQVEWSSPGTGDVYIEQDIGDPRGDSGWHWSWVCVEILGFIIEVTDHQNTPLSLTW